MRSSQRTRFLAFGERHLAKRRITLFVVVSLIASFVYLVVAMPGMDHSADNSAVVSARTAMHDGMAMPMVTSVGPAEFEQLTKERGRILLNVHVPYDGELPQTDRFIPYTSIVERSQELPADKGTLLLVYCRTGRMSAVATQTLLGLGYTNITELSGGMDAWTTSGRMLLRRQPKDPEPTPSDATSTSIGV